ncbi:MAG: PAS domain-containing protein [Alphaproteobacteria bacterium]
MHKPAVTKPIEGPEALPDQGFRLIYDHWMKAKREGELPPVSAITPHSIPKNLLGDCSVMSIEDGPKRFYIRLVGTRVAQALGLDMTNTWGDDQPNATEVKSACVQCVEERRPLYSEISTAWAGNSFMRSKTLMLPYAGPDKSVRRILSYIQFCYPTS